MTTNQLPGNPHFDEADHNNGSETFNLGQATLALAFEQRTANLIASIQPVRLSNGKEWFLSVDNGLAVRDLIARRLGL